MTEDEFKSTHTDEKSCTQYLRSRKESIGVLCRACGSKPAYFDYFNRRWRCEKCNMTMALTSSTVMAYSKFSLKHWLTAIYRMSENKSIPTKDLQ